MNFRNWSDVGNFPRVREFTSRKIALVLKLSKVLFAEFFTSTAKI